MNAHVVLVPLPDGRWLALNHDQLAAALDLGSSLMGEPESLSVKPRDDVLLVDAKELARLTGTTPSWWEAAARVGDAPCVFVGNRRRFDRHAALKWLESVQERDGSGRVLRCAFAPRGGNGSA